MTAVQWKDGWRPTGLPAEAAVRELELIRRRRGTLRAEVVVEEVRARGPGSPLHHAIFHVSVRDAADLYYAERARKIIQALVIVEPEEPIVVVRAFHSVVADEVEQYVPATEVVLDLELRAQVTERLKERLRALRRELKAWEEFADLVAAIDQAVGV